MGYLRISPLPVDEGGTGATTLTDHGVLLGSGTAAVTALGVATNGQVLTGVTGADPSWQAPAASSISITGDTGGALTGAAFTFTGGTTGLSFGGAGSTETVSGTLVVANGGTGATTLTDHGVLLGSGTAAITPLGAMTNGQLVIGSTGADPVVASLSAGTAVSITNGAGSITINSTGGGMAVVEVTGTSDTGDPDSAYIANNVGLVTITLNGTFALGSVIEVSGKGAGLWKIAQGAGQTCHVGLLNTTTGAGGSIAATAQYDSITLRNITANTDFVATAGVGNWLIV